MVGGRGRRRARRGLVAALATGLLVSPAVASTAEPPAAPAAQIAQVARAGHDRASDPRGPGVGSRGDAVRPPGSDGAARSRIQRYPGRVIRYWADVPKAYQWSVRMAAESWNRTGLDMTFTPSSRAASDLTIEIADIGFEGGLATLGYAPRRLRWVRLSPGMMGAHGFGGGLSLDERRVYTMHIVTHELGHTLGLEHRRTKCGLMGPILWVGQCAAWTTEPGFYNCQVVDSTDLRRAVGLYGGRRSLAPRSCPLDPLPPALRDVAITGGGPDGEPARISWRAPSSAPPGTKVQVFRREGGSCDLAPRGDGSNPPRYPSALDVREVGTGSGPVTFATDRNERDYCFGVRSVNASGGGGRVSTRSLTLFVPQPDAPTVEWVRAPYSEPGSYYARLTVPAGLSSPSVFYRAGPTGACPTGFDPDTWERAWKEEGLWSAPLYDADAETPAPCFSFVVVAGGRDGQVATYQTGSEPPPGTPGVAGIVHEADGSYRVTLDSAPPFGQDVLALVGPGGSCAATAWPDAEDPRDHLVFPDQGSFAVFDDTPHACLTMFLIDGVGRIGPGVAVQAPAAPLPVAPTVGDVSLQPFDGTVRFHAAFDATRFTLWALVAEDCQAAWPPEQTYSDAWEEDGWWYATNYVEGDHPTVTVFTRNVDGVFSTPVCVRL